MESRDLPIELVLRVLPLTPELTALREAILAESVGDNTRLLTGSAAFTTVDQRVVPNETLKSVVAAAESRAVGHVRAMYASLGDVLHALAENNVEDVLDRFVELGEAAREEGAWQSCVDWFTVV